MGTQCLWSSHIWQPWKGCHRVSEGCQNCYMFPTRLKLNKNPNLVEKANTLDWNLPYRLKEGFVQVCSQSDFFVADADVWREEAWNVIRNTPNLTYQILTKRPERIIQNLPPDWGAEGWPHVWLGVSTENQVTCDIRIPRVMDIPAARYFISAQPLLEPLSILSYLGPRKISLVLAGCESGKKSRAADPAWFDLLERQCELARVRYFLIQQERPDRRPGELKVIRGPFFDGRHCHWSNYFPFRKKRA